MAGPAPARAPCGMPCARKPDRPCRAGRRTQRRPPLPAVWFSWAPQAGLPPGSRAARAQLDARHGIVRPRSPKGAAGQSRRTGMRREPVAVMSEATPSRKANRQAHSACGGAAKGGMGAGAAARRLARRIRQPWTGSRDGNRARAAAPAGMPKGARRAGSKAARRRGVTPNGPAGLRSGQRQRRAGNQIFGPVAFIAFNGTRHGYFCLMCLLKL